MEVLDGAAEPMDLRSLAAGIAHRIDPTTPFRWTGDPDWIQIDDAFRDQLEEAFQRIRAMRPALLLGATWDGVELLGMNGAPALRLAFLGSGEIPYRVWVQDAARCPKAYRVVPPVAVWADKETPLVASWMEAITDLVLRVAGRVAARRRDAPSPSGQRTT